MNSFKKFSMLALATLITSSLFVACSDEISENTVDTPYASNTGNIKSAGSAVDLGLPSGTKWANMNVGATSESDNGILFNWGDATGTQMMPGTSTTYTDVIDGKTAEELFNMYKGEEKVGYLYDTLNVYKDGKTLWPADLDIKNIDATIQDAFDLVKDGKNGKLVGTVTNGEKVLCYCYQSLPSGALIHVNNPEYWDEENKAWKEIEVDNAESYELVVDLIDSTEVKYFENVAGSNNYKEYKDVFDKALMHSDYDGGEFTVPAYLIIANAQRDPATANWGSDWCMPTADQLKELVEKCEWEFVGNGYRVTGPNKNSIFLPAAGYRFGDKQYGNGNAGYYASGEITGTYRFPSMQAQVDGSYGEIGGQANMPSVLIFQNGQFAKSYNVYNNLSSSYGFSVRPVQK